MNRGEIWLVDLDPAVDAEMKKTRPALIMSDDRLGKLPLKVIVPITGWKERGLRLLPLSVIAKSRRHYYT
jgi:mRNA interferase MazF